MAFLICSITSMSAQAPQSKKVVILDSLQAKTIIKQLVDGDVAKAENKTLKEMDNLTQIRLSELKASNVNLLKAYQEKQKEADELNKSISDKNDSLTKQKNKTTVFGVAGGTALFFGILAMIFR